MNTIRGRIRAAEVQDIAAMQEIERAAGLLFAEIGMDDVAAHAPPGAATLTEYIQGKRAWIAEVDAPALSVVGPKVAGYVLADIVDGQGHLEQVSVDPAYGRQGLGRMLIERVIAWTEAAGLPAVTLITFRDVQWNGPYYISLGFCPLADADLSPGLLALRAHEDELGLDRSARHVMRLDLPARDVKTLSEPSRQSIPGPGTIG